MNGKIVYMAALIAGLLCMVERVQAQSFSPPWADPMSGWLTVYDDRAAYEAGSFPHWDGGGAGTDLTGPYPLDELVTLTSDYYTFDFLPETNKWNSTGSGGTNFWRNASGTDGGKYLESLTYWTRTVTGTELNVLMEFTVNSNTFETSRYDFEAFIRVVNVADGTALTETNLNLNGIASGSYALILTNALDHVGELMQAGFRVLGTNANPASAAAYGGANITVTYLSVIGCDFEGPSPDPMTWEVEPYTISDNKIGMTATTATDITGVEYQFWAYKGASIPGDGFAGASPLVSDPHYVFEGLDPNQQYTFRARARDLSVSCGPNATGFTPPKSATTLPTDTTAPLPDPAEIASITASPISVSLTATPATDASAVEYNFVPTGTNGTASGWQSSNEYIDYGLTPETTYEYTVQVRDLSAAINMTAVSAPASVTTSAAYPFGDLWDGPTGHMEVYDDRAGYDTGPAAAHIGGSDLTGFYPLEELVTLTNDYNTFTFLPETNKWNSSGNGGTNFWRNASGTDGGKYLACHTYWSLTNYDTGYVQMNFTIHSNTLDTSRYDFEAFIRIVNPLGGSSYVETNLNLNGAAWGTFDLDLHMDASLNYSYAPLQAGFRVLGTNANPANAESYGGASVTFSSLDVVVIDDFWPDLSILSVVGDTATLQWMGVSGQTYNVQFKTNLTDVSWTPDAANQGITGAGNLTPTSTVVGDEVFYRIEME